MINKINRFARLALVAAFAAAPEAPALAGVDCTASAANHSELHRLPGQGYWMQAVSDKRMTYTAVGGVYSYLYNLETKMPEPITRDFDAFPIAPGDLYVHPTNGYSFYRMGDGENASPIYVDNASYGVYQSVGLLPETVSALDRTIRVAAGWAAGLFMDYRIQTLSNGQYRFERLFDKPVKVCRNIPSHGLDTQIPVLSRDGLMISGRDSFDQMTKIYRILKPRSGHEPQADCELLQTIPVETSKISFSFGNERVMFVIADPNTGLGRLVEMDIATGDLVTLSLPSEDVMYMTYRYDSSFRNDSALIYSRRLPGTEESDLVVIRPGSVARPTEALAPRLEAVGYAWGKACGLDLDADYARAVGSRLNSRVCDDLLTEENVSALPEEYRGLERTDLLAYCKRDDRVFAGELR